MFLDFNNGYFSENTGPVISWRKPEAGCLTDFLTYYQNWKPSYIREKLLPLLSTFFLREVVHNHFYGLLLFDQYKFDSVHRVKVRNGVQLYVIKWKTAWPEPRRRIDEAPQVRAGRHGQVEKSSGAREVCAQMDGGLVICKTDQDAMTAEFYDEERRIFRTDELTDMLDDAADIAKFVAEDGSCYITTDENMELVEQHMMKKASAISVVSDLRRKSIVVVSAPAQHYNRGPEEKKSKFKCRESSTDRATPQPASPSTSDQESA